MSFKEEYVWLAQVYILYMSMHCGRLLNALIVILLWALKCVTGYPPPLCLKCTASGIKWCACCKVKVQSWGFGPQYHYCTLLLCYIPKTYLACELKAKCIVMEPGFEVCQEGKYSGSFWMASPGGWHAVDNSAARCVCNHECKLTCQL